MKLYEISDQLLKRPIEARSLPRLADTEDDSIDVSAELEALQMQFSDKAQNIACLIRNLYGQNPFTFGT